MVDFRETIASGLTERYTELAGFVHELAAPLDEQQFWTKPFLFGNSFGHLVLHLTGNLNYYIGAQIAATGYVRDRPREFTATDHPSKEAALQKFGETVEIVVQTIRGQTGEDWALPYSAAGADAQNRFGMVLSCLTHLHEHVGQLRYLCFEWQMRV